MALEKSGIAGWEVLRTIFRSFHHPNYRLFFGGQGISLIGTWMQQIAMSWLTFRLTHSAFLLGVVGFTSQIPTFLLGSFTGVLVDRWNRRSTMVATQILAMIQALTLAFLVLTNRIAVWHIICLSLFLGLINALDTPTRQSFVIDLVEKPEDLGNAIALNSSMFNGARLVGPSVAGILIAIVGEGICFLINGLSFIAVIFSLLAMKIKPKERIKKQVPVWQGLKEGFSYAFGFPPIRSLLLNVAWGNFMGIPYIVLMPVFARDVFQGGAHTLGFLMAAVGSGAMLGAIYLASRRGILGLEKVIAVATGLFGIVLVIFSLSRVYVISLLLMMLAGFGMLIRNAGTNTALQTIVEDDKRGRVMSLYGIANIGMQPFGSLLAGSLAQKIGAPGTLMLAGGLCVLGAITFTAGLPALTKMIRPIYLRKGIILE